MKNNYEIILNIINEEIRKNKINIVELYWKMGKVLTYQNYSYKEIIKLERFLQTHYGIMVGFSRRNLNNIKKFYNTYDEKMLSLLKKVDWYKHLWIMRNGNDEKEFLLQCASEYYLEIEDLKQLLKDKDISRYKKLEKQNNDEMLKELLSLKNNRLINL